MEHIRKDEMPADLLTKPLAMGLRARSAVRFGTEYLRVGTNNACNYAPVIEGPVIAPAITAMII